MHELQTTGVSPTGTARTGVDRSARGGSRIARGGATRLGTAKIFRGAALVGLLSLLGAGAANPLQATRPAASPPPQVTLVFLNSEKQPVAGVPVELINNTPEAVFKSAGQVPAGLRLTAVKPGQIMFRGRTDEKGEAKIPKLPKGTYAYEAGHPDRWGYANGQIEIKDPKKIERIEVTLIKG